MPNCLTCRPGITGEDARPREDASEPARLDQLLLDILREHPAHDPVGGFSPLTARDWEDLVRQSARHHISPLLYHRLRTGHPDLPVPPAITNALRQACLDNAARNLRLFHNLATVLQRLHDDHIPVIALKGAHLATLVYDSPSLRFMGDLDLLVKLEDVPRVDRLLLALGCQPTIQNRIVGGDIQEFVYLMPKRDVCLEIHWNILSSEFPFTIDTAGHWERSRPARIAGVDTAVLCPEDLFLHLCLHAGCTHGYEPGLKLFCDIAELLRQDPGLDWDLVVRLTREAGAGKCVYLTLMLTREFLGITVPEPVMKALNPGVGTERFQALARDQVFSRKPRNGQPLSMWPAVARFWGTTRLRDKAVLFCKGFFLPRESMARLYPAPANSLRIYGYYVVRLRDILHTYGPDVWRWLRGHPDIRAVADEGNQLTTLKDWLMAP